MSLLLRNARLPDGEKPADLLIQNGKIKALGPQLKPPPGAAQIDCQNHLLCPGLIDACVWRRAENAFVGGICRVIFMPSASHPEMDLLWLEEAGGKDIRIGSAIHLTEALAGKKLANLASLWKKKEVFAFSNGANPVADAQVMARAMRWAADLGAPVMHQPEDPALAAAGVMNEGALSAQLGLPGIPWQAETIMVERDLRLAQMTGAKLHFQQLSSRHSLEPVKRAKDQGLPVSCGVSINHLLLDESHIEEMGGFRTFLKVSPPLRTQEDREALVEAVAEGVIDVIVSGHMPQNEESKRLPFGESAFGSAGVETLLPAALTLAAQGKIPLPRLIDAMTRAPAEILDLEGGRLEAGAPADLALCDMAQAQDFDLSELRSSAKNAALDGRTLQGRVLKTIIGGRIVFEREF